jgi:hypothetical protein
MSEDKNNEKPEDLLPDWMVNLLKPGNRLCHKCQKDLRLDDVFGIELFCTSPEDELGNGPKAAMDAYCNRCNITLRFMLHVPLPDLLHAVEGFYEYLVQYRSDGEPPAPTLPSPNTDPLVTPEIPLCDVDEGDDGESDDYPCWVKADRFEGLFSGLADDDSEENHIEASFIRRRSHYRKKLNKQISEKEIEIIRRRLAKTSFKRSSKGFKEFMALLGIDLDKNDNTEGGE